MMNTKAGKQAKGAKRPCALCRYCHVEGRDEFRQPLTHCHLGYWPNEKTLRGAANTRFCCDDFDSSADPSYPSDTKEAT